MSNLKINLQAKGIELTDAIRGHVITKVTNLGKYLENIGEAILIEFEVGKNTNHHNKGSDLFRAECMITIDGKTYRGENNSHDLYTAIDEVKDMLFRDISKDRDRERTLWQRGARSIKKRIKGFKPWPFH